MSDLTPTMIAIVEAHAAVMNEIDAALGMATLARTMQLNPPLSRLIAAVRADEAAVREAERGEAQARIETLEAALRFIADFDDAPDVLEHGGHFDDDASCCRDRARAALGVTATEAAQ